MLEIKVKQIYFFFDLIFAGVLGLTVVDTVEFTNELLHQVDDWFKITASLVGFVYFALMIPHRSKMRKLERAIKVEELEKIKRENDLSKD